jgi:hypothetical protein
VPTVEPLGGGIVDVIGTVMIPEPEYGTVTVSYLSATILYRVPVREGTEIAEIIEVDGFTTPVGPTSV